MVMIWETDVIEEHSWISFKFDEKVSCIAIMNNVYMESIYTNKLG